MADDAGRNALAAQVQAAIELRNELAEARKGGISNKDLLRFLQRKDGIVGGGQHHKNRNVTAGQIIGDLDDFIGKFGNV